MLPQYNTGRGRAKQDDPKIHPPPGSVSISFDVKTCALGVHTLCIVVLFALVIWLATRHHPPTLTPQNIEHHINALQLKSSRPPASTTRGHTYKLVLNAAMPVGDFYRFPPDGHVPRLFMHNVTMYRLCCKLPTGFYVCDYGQGATHNVGLECILHSDNGRDTSVDVYMQHESMRGATCTLYWH